MEGYISADREIIVALTLRAEDGAELEVKAALDTGFSDYVGLSRDVVDALGLPFFSSAEAVLADGRLGRFALHIGRIQWDGDWREVVVTVTEGGPLLGMGLLYGNLVSLEVIDGGSATIEPL